MKYTRRWRRHPVVVCVTHRTHNTQTHTWRRWTRVTELEDKNLTRILRAVDISTKLMNGWRARPSSQLNVITAHVDKHTRARAHKSQRTRRSGWNYRSHINKTLPGIIKQIKHSTDVRSTSDIKWARATLTHWYLHSLRPRPPWNTQLFPLTTPPATHRSTETQSLHTPVLTDIITPL